MLTYSVVNFTMTLFHEKLTDIKQITLIPKQNRPSLALYYRHVLLYKVKCRKISF